MTTTIYHEDCFETMECGRNGIGTEYGKEYYETMEKRIEKQKKNKI